MKAGATALIVSAMLATGCVANKPKQITPLEQYIAEQDAAQAEHNRQVQIRLEAERRKQAEEEAKQQKEEQAKAAFLKERLPCDIAFLSGYAVGEESVDMLKTDIEWMSNARQVYPLSYKYNTDYGDWYSKGIYFTIHQLVHIDGVHSLEKQQVYVVLPIEFAGAGIRETTLVTYAKYLHCPDSGAKKEPTQPTPNPAPSTPSPAPAQ